MPRQMDYTYYDSPIGALLLAGTDKALHLISFPTGSRTKQPEEGWRENADRFAPVILQLEEYFAGTRLAFDLPLKSSGSDFRKRVWQALEKIPFGETISYGELAKRVGNPKASQAVGGANRENNLPIIIPCHRVIRTDGTLAGFGGGLKTQKRLIKHEQAIAPPKNQQDLLFS